MTEPSTLNVLDRLQSAEREQGLIQLRMLLAQNQQSLLRLPKLAANVCLVCEG